MPEAIIMVLYLKKYSLEIEKNNHLPITFDVKVDLSPEAVMTSIKESALIFYPDEIIRAHYISCFEEVITIPTLRDYLSQEIMTDKL